MNVHPLRQPQAITSRQVSRESDITSNCKNKSDQMNILNDVDEKRISNHLEIRPSSSRDETPNITQRASSERDPIITITSASNNAGKVRPSTKISTTRALASRIYGENNNVDTSTIHSSNHASMSALAPPIPDSTKSEIPDVVDSCKASSNTVELPATSQRTTSLLRSLDNMSCPSNVNGVGMKRKMPSKGNDDFIPTQASSQTNTSISRRDSLPLGLRNKKMKATDCLLFAATLLEQDVEEMLVTTSGNPSTEKSNSLLSKDNVMAMRNIATPFVPPVIASPPVKKTKPLKKMVCEKIERSLQEVALRKERERKLQDHQQEQERQEYNDCENNPKDADVLCGRGGKVNKHPGNIVYRKVVEYNKSYYQSVHKKHRILVSQSIVKAILNYGGRFMGQKGKEWTPICFKRAVQKTSQALRERSNSSDVPIQGVVGEYNSKK